MEVVRRLGLPDEAAAALVECQSLALDDPGSLVEAGGAQALCQVLQRSATASNELREAALCLFLLLEDGGRAAVGAVADANGAGVLTEALRRPELPLDSADWARSALDILAEHRPETLAFARRGARLGALTAVPEPEPELEAPPVVLGVYRLMRRTITRRGAELDSKRGATLEPPMDVRPLEATTLGRGFERLRLEQGWVSECGMDGKVILELIDPRDGLTDTERAARDKADEAAAQMAKDEERKQQEADRRARFRAEERDRRTRLDDLAETFRGLRGQLAELQGEREAASRGVIIALGSLQNANAQVSEAQHELELAEQRKVEAELDGILALRAMPGMAGGGLSEELTPHQRGGAIVTVSVPTSVAKPDSANVPPAAAAAIPLPPLLQQRGEGEPEPEQPELSAFELFYSALSERPCVRTNSYLL